jgi:hypothetical protein
MSRCLGRRRGVHGKYGGRSADCATNPLRDAVGTLIWSRVDQ